jgi:hypothetical protein
MKELVFDWTKPVDGSDPATEWHGVLSIDETPGLLNPGNGWLYNVNNWALVGGGSQHGRSERRRLLLHGCTELGRPHRAAVSSGISEVKPGPPRHRMVLQDE